jgi:hypothetical protein
LSGLACFLSGDLAPQDLWNSKKIKRRLAAPKLRVFWRHCCELARRFSLSGLACFLSGDLAPQDLWNSKKVEKAAVLSPNLVDYLLVLISNFKVLAMIFNQYTIASSILYL